MLYYFILKLWRLLQCFCISYFKNILLQNSSKCYQSLELIVLQDEQSANVIHVPKQAAFLFLFYQIFF